MIYALGGGLLLSRLVFVALHPEYFRDHPAEIFAVWQGGLSAAGGMLGALIGILAYSRTKPGQPWNILDALAVPALILSTTAWIGIWLDGVAYGIQIPAQWTVFMNSDPFQGEVARWPTQIVGAVSSLIALLLLIIINPRWPSGIRAGLTWSTIALILVVVSFFRADPSMLILGLRLDMLGPAALAIIGLGATSYRWIQPSDSRN
jgi:phosphatidylglycerol:prolipoprotein diacylglycerol transferase